MMTPEPPVPNYVPKVAEATAGLRLAAGTFQHVNVYHDEWCAMLAGGVCNCSPDVLLGPTEAAPAAGPHWRCGACRHRWPSAGQRRPPRCPKCRRRDRTAADRPNS